MSDPTIPVRPAPPALSAEEAATRALIDDALIERLVRRFYERVREDDLIGPIFAERIGDWEPHLQKMFAFWSSVALGTGRYEGNPMGAHLPLPVESRHFDRWLALFEETARELCPPDVAEHFISRAWRIAASLEMGAASRRGELIPTRRRPGR